MFTIYKKKMPSQAKMMSYEININNAIEMLDEKKTYWFEKLSDVTFDIMCINKISDVEKEKLKNKENEVKNVIKDIEKSILELENMEKNKINKIKIIINNTMKKLDAARMEEIKNLEEIRIQIAYKKKELDTEMKILENEENNVKNIIEEIEKLKIELRFIKRCIILNIELDKLFLLYK